MKCRALPGEAGESFAHVVDGIELWSPTSDATRQTLRDWFAEHSLLVFQRQALGDSELVQVAELFGTPREYAETHWQTSRPEVVYVSNMRGANGEFIGGLGNKELTWHTDQSYYATPVTGCFLYAAMVPREAGGTTWASLYDAYERLAPSTRNRLEDAIGTFSYRARVHHGGDRIDNHDPHRLASTPDVRHRLVQRHPRTGRRALYIDPNTVTGIEGYPDEDAQALLAECLDAVANTPSRYRHQWCAGDLVLWDNGVLLHRREPMASSNYRILKRSIIALPSDRHIVPNAV